MLQTYRELLAMLIRSPRGGHAVTVSKGGQSEVIELRLPEPEWRYAMRLGCLITNWIPDQACPPPGKDTGSGMTKHIRAIGESEIKKGAFQPLLIYFLFGIRQSITRHELLLYQLVQPHLHHHHSDQ